MHSTGKCNNTMMIILIEDMDIPFPFYHIQPVGGLMSEFHTILLAYGVRGEIAIQSRYTTFICLN